MSFPLRTVGLIVLAAALGLAPAQAQPETLRGTWVEAPEVPEGRVAGVPLHRLFQLRAAGDGTYRARVAAPGPSGAPRRLTLRPSDEGWELRVEGPVERRGIADALEEGRDADPPDWTERAVVPLERRGERLVAPGWRIQAPDPPSSTDQLQTRAGQGTPTVDTRLGLPARPRVRVLVSGFDRFPTLPNHPRWRLSSEPDPGTNPSGWAVRELRLEDLDPALRERARIELRRLPDVAVVYQEGAREVTEAIRTFEADVAISFGVGADGGADADVERTTTNVMDDDRTAFSASFSPSLEEGPFVLPNTWPPDGASADWSEAERRWLRRYPDNAGVSYNGAPIDRDAPEELESNLPVARIVSRIEDEGLRAIDGGDGPGRYICNNVMYRVIQTQRDRGAMGGFVHVGSWDPDDREKHLRVVVCAIEESVAAWLDRREDPRRSTPELHASRPASEAPAPTDPRPPAERPATPAPTGAAAPAPAGSAPRLSPEARR